MLWVRALKDPMHVGRLQVDPFCLLII